MEIQKQKMGLGLPLGYKQYFRRNILNFWIWRVRGIFNCDLNLIFIEIGYYY